MRPTAQELIAAEVARQDRMWGAGNERADVSRNQLFHAALAQLGALFNRQNGIEWAFDGTPYPYPSDWAGFRDYGSDIANLAVAAAYLQQEIKRKLNAGEDCTRRSRDPVAQPYGGVDQPAVIEP